MKKLLVFALLAAVPAMAGRMDEIVIMTTESVEQSLGLLDPNVTYQITSQDFTKAAVARDLAVKTELVVTKVDSGKSQEWTCVTQFVKTPRFFEVSETDCY